MTLHDHGVILSSDTDIKGCTLDTQMQQHINIALLWTRYYGHLKEEFNQNGNPAAMYSPSYPFKLIQCKKCSPTSS